MITQSLSLATFAKHLTASLIGFSHPTWIYHLPNYQILPMILNFITFIANPKAFSPVDLSISMEPWPLPTMLTLKNLWAIMQVMVLSIVILMRVDSLSYISMNIRKLIEKGKDLEGQGFPFKLRMKQCIMLCRESKRPIISMMSLSSNTLCLTTILKKS